jgi:hypothetical protein
MLATYRGMCPNLLTRDSRDTPRVVWRYSNNQETRSAAITSEIYRVDSHSDGENGRMD